MKTARIFFMLSIALCTSCATRPPRNLDNGLPGVKTEAYRPRIAPIGLALASGLAYGIHETVVHHPDRIPESWDRQWWDASRSWTNKYKAGDPAQGEKFPGSTTVLVWATDAKHAFGTAHRLTMFASGVTLTIGEKRPTWHYIADAALSFAAFGIGFHSMYSLAFRP